MDKKKVDQRSPAEAQQMPRPSEEVRIVPAGACVPTGGWYTKLADAHERFLRAFSSLLEIARQAGDCILHLETETGLRGEQLFERFRSETGSEAADSTLYGYRRVGARWCELVIKTGGNISGVTYTRGMQLLAAPRSRTPSTASERDQEPPARPAEPADEAGDESADETVHGRALVRPATDLEPLPEALEGEPESAQSLDLLAALTQVVRRLEFLAQQARHVDDGPTLAALAERAVDLIHQIRARAG